MNADSANLRHTPSMDFELVYGRQPADSDSLLFVSIFSESHRHQAERLHRSLERFLIPHALFRVPSVHCSISPKAGSDPRYSKPHIIIELLSRFRRPLVYLDADVVVEQEPSLLYRLGRESSCFAVLNWLAVDQNDGWIPLTANEQHLLGVVVPRNLYRHIIHIDARSKTQLACSGPVQFWRDSPAASRLLNDWYQAILDFPGVVDDHCLDFAYNNLPHDARNALNATWLPKSYARYAWWIFDQPVINHPQFPYDGSAWREIDPNRDKKRIYLDQCSTYVSIPLDRDWILDLDSREVFRMVAGRLELEGVLDSPLWP